MPQTSSSSSTKVSTFNRISENSSDSESDDSNNSSSDSRRRPIDDTSLISFLSEEDEWEEERKMFSRYIPESEIEQEEDDDVDFSSKATTSRSRSEPPQLIQKSIGDLLKAQKKSQISNIHTSSSRPNNKSNDHTQPLTCSPTLVKKRHLEHRSNKHAPMTMSSKRPVTRRRTVVELPKLEEPRDPRFDSLSGAIQPELLQRSYGFLSSQRQAEVDQLGRAYALAKKSSIPHGDLKRMENALRRAENEQVQSQKIQQERQALKTWKVAEKLKQQDGKTAFYLKKKHQKDVILANRFEHLSHDKRKLLKAMERKKKKVAGKEKKSMPIKRARL